MHVRRNTVAVEVAPLLFEGVALLFLHDRAPILLIGRNAYPCSRRSLARHSAEMSQTLLVGVASELLETALVLLVGELAAGVSLFEDLLRLRPTVPDAGGGRAPSSPRIWTPLLPHASTTTSVTTNELDTVVYQRPQEPSASRSNRSCHGAAGLRRTSLTARTGQELRDAPSETVDEGGFTETGPLPSLDRKFRSRVPFSGCAEPWHGSMCLSCRSPVPSLLLSGSG